MKWLLKIKNDLKLMVKENKTENCSQYHSHYLTKLGGATKMSAGASLVAQWLRICLLMQGTRVRALVWEDPTCRGATRPVSHNY